MTVVDLRTVRADQTKARGLTPCYGCGEPARYLDDDGHDLCPPCWQASFPPTPKNRNAKR